MASVTLPESAKLCQDQLISGVIESIVTVDDFYELLPFEGIDGNSLAYNRENALGDVQSLGVGGTITAKAAATFTQVTSGLTKIIGDAEVDGLTQATRSAINDQTSQQVASKAKSAGRSYRNQLINGTGAADQFNGLINLCAVGQKVATGTSGGALSFEWLDNLLDLVVSKDGDVDYILMHARTRRSYKTLLRSLGGVPMEEVYELPSGKRLLAYSGVPIFRNDNIPITQTKGMGSNQTTVFAGVFDDGDKKTGLAGLTAANAYGLHVEKVGISETKDETIWRVKWYCGLALFSELGLAAMDGITN
jgi:HK97 family phage major capsid protein